MENLLSKDIVLKLEDDLAKDFGGVYLLFDEGECVYVGESECIPYRLKTHLKEGVKKFDSFRFFFCDNRKDVESMLIRILQPKYNITGTRGWLEHNSETLSSGKRYLSGLTDKIESFVSCIIREHNPVWVSEYYLKNIFRDCRSYFYLPVLKKYNAVRYEMSSGEKIAKFDFLLIAKLFPILMNEIRDAQMEWELRPISNWGTLVNQLQEKQELEK